MRHRTAYTTSWHSRGTSQRRRRPWGYSQVGLIEIRVTRCQVLPIVYGFLIPLVAFFFLAAFELCNLALSLRVIGGVAQRIYALWTSNTNGDFTDLQEDTGNRDFSFRLRSAHSHLRKDREMRSHVRDLGKSVESTNRRLSAHIFSNGRRR